jgi:hypothetical protein
MYIFCEENETKTSNRDFDCSTPSSPFESSFSHRTLRSDNHSSSSSQHSTHTPSPTSHFSRDTRSQSSTASRDQRCHSNKLRADVSSNVCSIRCICNSSRSRRTQGRQQGSRRRRIERRSRCSLRISTRGCICRFACRSSREIANFVGLTEVVCKADGSWLILVREQQQVSGHCLPS